MEIVDCSEEMDNEIWLLGVTAHFDIVPPVLFFLVHQAVTLSCAHSFCSFCIQSWRKRKDECPICRQEIKSQTRSLVLDNCINRMVDKLSQEMKDRRMALILERKDLAQSTIPTPIPIPAPTESDSSSSDLSFISILDSSDDGDLEESDDFGDSSIDSELSLDSGDDYEDLFFQ
ncbi:hypothetical protein AB205_0146470 [Aquarana catesbeiana]|uniref:RING-type domain-containing protein n=1 Tax=Aquarana catesbeiana TaxID=8400 RepID=A0A2G9R4U9_AQUCT|nr:hypothetical protein AB205_0146470 [Aquarana catesbeiana]